MRRAGHGQKLERGRGVGLERGGHFRYVDRVPLRAHGVGNVHRLPGDHAGEVVVEQHAKIPEIVDLAREVADRPAHRERPIEQVGVLFGSQGGDQTPLRHADNDDAGRVGRKAPADLLDQLGHVVTA